MKPENLTAWALNELSAEEQARLEAELSTDPAAQASAETTKNFCTFLTRELRDESMALTPEQRAQFTLPKVPEITPWKDRFESKPLRWWQRHAIPLAVAAAVVVGGMIFIQLQRPEEQTKHKYIAQFSAEKVRVSPLQDSVSKRRGESTPSNLGMPQAEVTASWPQRRASDIAVYDENKQAEAKVTTKVIEELRLKIQPTPIAQSAPASPMPMLASAEVRFPGNSSGQVSGGIVKTGTGSVAVRVNSSHTEDAVTRRRALVKDLVDSALKKRKESNTESYTTITENALISVAREPLSTFSIDVDTASYANVRRFLNQNTKPPRDAVRVEELINYFPSTEPAPDADSKQPFTVKAEMAACPWQPQHRLARIHLKGRDVAAGSKPSNLVFLVDVSGSMSSEDKLELVKRSLRMLAERLGENDRVSLVTYAGGTEVVLPTTNGLKKADIIDSIDRLQAGGSTAGAAGIKLAYEQAVSGFIQSGVNRVILCTDGDFNVGISDPKELEGFITEKARSGVFLSVLGFGTGNLKDRTMETLADKGNGNYAYIDSVSEARKVLVEQMQGTLVTIAKDVKIQVEFNPALIREYRLIGYENRLLAKEDFNDDTKDAGEIGAGHSITALYELVPANLPPGATPPPLVDKLKYQPEAQQLASPPPVKTLAPATNEALTVKLRYKEPEGTTSKLLEVPLNDDARAIEKASPEFKFTAAVAGFGMLLRESSYAGQLTWDEVRKLAREGKGSDALGYRGEFLQLIEKAAVRK
jgi:secreted protein with Ig-like and vWFA domain